MPEIALPASTALVTGASSGIGRAIAARLRQEGFDVIALGRTAEPLRRLRDECGARPLVLDIRDQAAIAAELGGEKVDILVNAAGILSTRALFQDIEPAEIEAMIGINLTAPLQLARLLLPGMVERRRGHLVFVGSIAGRWPHPQMSVYGTSKAGLSLFCDSLRCDLLGTGVRVSEIVPGRVETQLYRNALDAAGQRELYEGYAPIQPDDLAELVATVIAMPQHVDVSRMEVLPTDQAVGGGRMVKAQK